MAVRIIKKHGYHYLQVSYKKEGKVISKEKYLGKNIPKDVEQIKEEFLRQIHGETLFKKFDLIKRNYQKEWKRFPPSIKEKVRKELTVKFTYNTNAIEGSTITLEETKELIEKEITPNKPLKDVQETLKHAKAFFNIWEEKHQNLNLNLILKWHKNIFEESKPDLAGKIRDYLVRVGEYLCPDWQDLPELLKEFFKWYHNEKDKLHPVELAAKAHFKLVRIHPFGDGNGRISRLVTNFILIRKGFPIMIIEYKKRKSYYWALAKADKKGEEEFLKYFYRRYLNNYKNYLDL